MRQPIKPQVNNRRGIERQQLAYEQSADNRDAQWMPQLRASASPQCERQSAQQRRHCGHHDGPETQQARLIYRLFRRFVLDSFSRTERPIIAEVLDQSAKAVRTIIRDGVLKAMSDFN